MATYYVNAQTGNDSDDGSASAPWQTLTYAAANSTDGDALKLAGVFREADVVISGSSNRVITNWTSTRWKLRNTQLITGWTARAGYYNKTIATGLSAKCLIVDWDTSRTATGQHYGHVQAVSSAASVPGTDNSWNYNSGTGELRVRIGANLDPAGFTVELGLGGSAALIQAEDCTNCEISGFDMGPNCDGNSGKGYSIIWSGVGNVVHDGEDTDCGYHGPGLVANGSYALRDNFCYNYRSYGSWGDGAVAQLSRFVTYIGTGTASGNQYSNCWAYKTLPILRDGTTYMTAPVSGGTAFKSSGGFFWHSGTGNHASLTHFRCRSIGISGGTVATTIDFCGQDATGPASASAARNPDNYGVKNIECVVTFGDSNLSPGAGLNTSQAFIRCRLDYGGISTIGSSQVRCGYTGATASGSYWGHFGTQLTCNLNNASGRTLYGVTSANQLLFVNCSFLEYGSNSNNNFRNFFNWASTPTVGIYCRNCVFAYATTNVTKSLQTNDSTIAAGLHDFLGCAYRNMTANFYSANTAFDSQAEWTSTVDTQATIASVDPYADMSGAGDLVLVPTLAAVVRPWQPGATIGVNGVAMGKQLGSWGTLYEPGEARSSGGRGARVGRVVRV